MLLFLVAFGIGILVWRCCCYGKTNGINSHKYINIIKCYIRHEFSANYEFIFFYLFIFKSTFKYNGDSRSNTRRDANNIGQKRNVTDDIIQNTDIIATDSPLIDYSSASLPHPAKMGVAKIGGQGMFLDCRSLIMYICSMRCIVKSE